MSVNGKFKHAVKRGTGEAYWILKNNPAVDFSNEIADAILKNYAYDRQAEGSRCAYLWELMTLSGEHEKFKRNVLQGLCEELEDDWVLEQVYELAYFYAREGDLVLKKAMYDRFFTKKIEGNDTIGFDYLIQLDGLDALFYIARMIGQHCQFDTSYIIDDFILYEFSEHYSEVNALEELEKKSLEDESIATFTKRIDKRSQKGERLVRPDTDFKKLLERIEDDKHVLIPSHYVKSLTESEIELLAKNLLTENYKPKLVKYLSIFSKIKFPFPYSPLLGIANGVFNENDHVVGLAVDALRFFSGDDIRRLYEEKISDAKCPAEYTNLLIGNYKEGDAIQLKELVLKETTEQGFEDFANSFVEIYEANKTKECHYSLVALYDQMTCAIHRKYIVQIMIEQGVLPDRIWKELEFDCHPPTRLLKRN